MTDRKLSSPFRLGGYILSLACGSGYCQSVQLPSVQVTDSLAAQINESPAAIGQSFRLILDRLADQPAQIDQILVGTGLVNWDASNSLGLANGVGMRGFALGNQSNQQLQSARNFLNGHADIAWRFARDSATVSALEVLQGHDSTLLGAGSPGGTIQYISKTPTGTEFNRLQLRADSGHEVRVVLDSEVHGLGIQSRGVLAVQRRGLTVEGAPNDRTSALISTRLPWHNGSLRLDVEYHGNSMPFPFGTAYAGGRFWLDQSYADSRSFAKRHYRRHALYAEQKLGSNIDFDAHWQSVRSTRQERLIGFFDPFNDKQLRGYFRLIDEQNAQQDAGLRVRGRQTMGTAAHLWTVVLQRHTQDRTFNGPQSIGGFRLDLMDPVFPTDLNAIALSPRFVQETYHEQGLGFASAWLRGPLELRAGVRRSSVRADSTQTPADPLATVVSASHTSASVGASVRWTDTDRFWMSYAQSFQVNRGRFASGEYLPPSEGRQIESGWQRKVDAVEISFQAFQIRQSNLATRDPENRDAFVLMEGAQSRGVSANGKWKQAAFVYSANMTFQYARASATPNSTQGTSLVGVPARYGALGVDGLAPYGRWLVELQGIGKRPGDSSNSFSAPGYGVWNFGWRLSGYGGAEMGIRIDNATDRRYVRALTGNDNVWQGERRKLKVWTSLAL